MNDDDDSVKTFAKRVLVFGMAFLLFTPFFPAVGAQEHFIHEGGWSEDITDYDVETALATMGDADGGVLEGFVLKGREVEGEIDPADYGNQFAVHEIKEGDTLSSIAAEYGVSPTTIKQSNGFRTNLRPGQYLYVPSVDGTLHFVSEGDTAADIAELYDADLEDIISQNDLDGDGHELSTEDVLVVPGATVKPPEPVVIASSGSSGSTYVSGGGYTPPIHPPSAATPVGGWIWPTSSNVVITQRFSGARGHAGVDAASRASPPIYAASNGVVERVKFSSYGYGNHVIINHGNGFKSLYAHLASISVREGQSVAAGDVLGPMGTTGRSTGIHLHWEVHYNGLPQNPFNYARP